MRKKIISFVIFLMLTVSPAHGENAADYFDLALKSSLIGSKIKYFSKALEMDPYLAEAYEKRGMLYFFQEKFDRAIQDFKAYIRIAPSNAEAYRMLGICYLKSNYYEHALDRFTRAIELQPELIGAYVYRAEAYRLKGMFEEAIQDATVGIQGVCDSRTKSDAYRTRAKAFRETGRDDLAAADANAAWDIDPRIPMWWRYFLKYASPEELRHIAPFMIIAIIAVLFFGLKFKPPEKDE